MTKLVQNDITSLTNEQSALAALNANYASLEVFSDSVLSRDGTSPNQMQSDLDMNSNHILNLPDPASDLEPLRVKDLTDFVGGSGLVIPQATYVTLSTNALLNNERVLTAGTNISLTDAGAGSTVTVAINGADLNAVEALSTNGLATRTATNTWTTRTITGTTNEIGLTNGDGVSGNPVVGVTSGIKAGAYAYLHSNCNGL